jgi:MraZ protein
MFLGEFSHSLDDKGRVTIPAKLRAGFADGLVITRGFEPCHLSGGNVSRP